MRPDIKRMNERLGYFLHEMDLANARADHAEREIERLEKELHDTRGENGFLFARNIELENMAKESRWATVLVSGLREEIKRSEEKIDEVRQTTGREWLQKYNEANNHLKLAQENQKTLQEDIDELIKENARLMMAIKQSKEEVRVAQRGRIVKMEDCSCGNSSAIVYEGKTFCRECFKKNIIFLDTCPGNKVGLK